MRELKKRPVWVVWRYTDRDGQRTKVPINPRSGRFARTNDPTTWGTFDEAQRAVKKLGCDGVGFVFGDELCGVDVDSHGGENPLQSEILRLFEGTYVEKSPSGSGLHILLRCDRSRLPLDENGKLQSCYYLKNPHNSVEFYGGGLSSRFFTYTGDRVSDSDEITDKTAETVDFLERYMRREDVGRERQKLTATARDAAPAVYRQTVNDEIEETLKIARRSRNGEKFSALYDRGDTTLYNGDDSAADLALCNLLAFFLRGDENLIDAAFRRSALYREKWNRNDYRESTVRKAISLCGGEYYRKPGRPRASEAKNGDGGELFTIEALQSYLDERGCDVRLNVLTQRTELSGFEGENTERLAENAPAIIFNELQSKHKKISPAIISDFLNVIASRNAYNPVLETLSVVKFDGVDRLSELSKILDITDELSQTLVHKWLLQCISLLRNGEGGSVYGADGVLVLCGPQGVGKTSFFRRLALESRFFGEGCSLDFRDKDSCIKATGFWITELAEIESTFRTDVEKLKSFLTNPTDELRRPYARAAAKTFRRTSFCGSCNSEKFLIDESGNRRFWVVPVQKIDLDRLARLDVLQLWAQIAAEAEANPQGFRLTQEEQQLLAERNSQHERPLRGENEVLDVLSLTDTMRFKIQWTPQTVTEFKMNFSDELKSVSVADIGRILDKIGHRAEVRKVCGRTQRLRTLPRRVYNNF